MATVWIRGGLIAWLKGASATRRADTPLRGSKQEDDDEPLYDQAALDAAVMSEREACASIADARAMRCEAKTADAEDDDEVTQLRSLAWQFSVLAAEMRKRSNA